MCVTHQTASSSRLYLYDKTESAIYATRQFSIKFQLIFKITTSAFILFYFSSSLHTMNDTFLALKKTKSAPMLTRRRTNENWTNDFHILSRAMLVNRESIKFIPSSSLSTREWKILGPIVVFVLAAARECEGNFQWVRERERYHELM